MTVEKTKHKRTKKLKAPMRMHRPKWSLLFGAFQEAIHWGLDAAARLAHDYPHEVEKIERVRAFVDGRINAQAAPINLDDVLFTFAIAMAALEADRGTQGAFGAWIEKAPIRVKSPTDLERQWLEQVLWTYDTMHARLRSAA